MFVVFGRAPFVLGGTVFCLVSGAGLVLLGQFLRRCPTERHCMQVAGEPGQESRTFWLSMLMIEGRVSPRFLSELDSTSISHLEVKSLVPLIVTGAISLGRQNSAMMSLICWVMNFLPLIGTLSSLMWTTGGSLPFGGRIGISALPTVRTFWLMKSLASSSSSKKIWMNLVSARNLVAIAVSGRALAMPLPSKSFGIFWRSRKAEFLSAAGGVREDSGRRPERLL